MEKANNSQLTREIQIALPRELSITESYRLVLEYVRENFVNHGMCADIAIHTDSENKNPHCHILLTMRPFHEDGTWGDKQKKVYHLDNNGEKIYDPKKRQYKCSKIQTTDWNERHKAEEWRASWADNCNEYLSRHNHSERINHKSYKRQGKSQTPTIHLGVAAQQMEQRGIHTERGNINRVIEISNRKLRKIEGQLNDLYGWLSEEKTMLELQFVLSEAQPAGEKPPTFADAILDMFSRQVQGKPLSYADNELFDFLKTHCINDYEWIEQHLKKLMAQQRKLSQEFSPIRKRIAELAEHISQRENYKKCKTEYSTYQQDLANQPPWKKKSFTKENHYIIEKYKTAKLYIDDVRNADGKIPLASWKREYSELSAKVREMEGRYHALKNEVAQVDKFRVWVYDILRKERQIVQPIHKRSDDTEI